MKKFIGEQLGRIVVLHLKRGEKLLETITEQLKELGIKDAIVLNGIGSLQKVKFHIAGSTAAKDEPVFTSLENTPIELGAIQGMVLNGNAHFHMIVSHLDKTLLGHVDPECEVLYLAEITLAELKGVNVDRIVNDVTGVGELIPRV
jgi:uncharacterized protein